MASFTKVFALRSEKPRDKCLLKCELEFRCLGLLLVFSLFRKILSKTNFKCNEIMFRFGRRPSFTGGMQKTIMFAKQYLQINCIPMNLLAVGIDFRHFRNGSSFLGKSLIY